MNDAVYDIILPLQNGATDVYGKVRKGDTARMLRVFLADGGVPYKIAEGCDAYFIATTPSGVNLYHKCEIVDNVICYRFERSTVADPGEMPCEIRLYGSDYRIISSPGFTLAVDETLYDDEFALGAEHQYTALDDMVVDGNNTIAAMRELTDEVQRKLNNGEFVGPQGPQGPQGEQGPAGADAEAGHVDEAITLEEPDDSTLDARLTEVYEALEDGKAHFFTLELKYWAVGGWYCSVLYGTWFFRMYKLRNCIDGTVCGIAEGLHDQGYRVIRKYTDTDGWGEWLWENPPVTASVDMTDYAWAMGSREYATTEMYNGKNVYTQIVDCGAMPSNGSKQIDVTDYVGYEGQILRCTGVTEQITIPMVDTNQVTVHGWKDSLELMSFLYLYNSTDIYYDAHVYVQFWYTKE